MYRRTVITLRLSSCGDFVTAHSELDGEEQYRTYSLSALRAACQPKPWCPMDMGTYPVIHSAEAAFGSGSFKWTTGSDNLDKSMVGSLPLRVWTLRQWWPVIGKVPEWSSRIILYMQQGAGGCKWKIAQYYSTPDGPWDYGCHCRTRAAEAGASTTEDESAPPQHEEHALATSNPTSQSPSPVTLCRFTADITKPQLLPQGDPSLPLVAISFNHVGWIELVQPDVQPNTGDGTAPTPRLQKRRIFKMVTFPDPTMCPCSDSTSCECGTQGKTVQPQVSTLDIPNGVLSKACHIIIDPITGSILITTSMNKLHTFKYS